MKHFIHTINHSARAAATLLLAVLTVSTAWAEDVTISSAADWDSFANAVNSGTSYSGQTVTLGTDITVSTIAGTSTNKFSGTFYGGGHTLTFNATATADGCAPFGYIDGATFKCLKVAGTISTGYKYAAGIAAHSYGNCTIQSCQSSVVINTSISGDGTHAGFVAVEESGCTLTVTNCLFDGSISGGSTNNCGGFVGWRNGSLTFTNCLMAGTMAISQTDGSALFNRNGSSTLTNCHYDGSKSYGSIAKQGTATTATGIALQALLGSGWKVSDENVVPDMDAKSLSNATVSGINNYYPYTGYEIAIDYTVTAADGTVLTKGTHYTETISPGTVQQEGDYTLTITGTGDYSGSQSFTFTVSDGWKYYEEGELKRKPYADVTVINSGNKPTSLSGWYVVTGDVSYNGRISLTGETHLILADGATMTVTHNNHAIYDPNQSLYIYGQEQGSGTLNISASGSYIRAIWCKHFYMYGGIVNAKGDSKNGDGFHSTDGSFNFKGGVGRFSGSNYYYGVDTNNGSINISWTSDADEFYTNKTNRPVTLGKSFWIRGTETEATTDNLAGQTIVPAGSRAIDISETENGSVTTDKRNSAADKTVTITATPIAGYGVESVSVRDADNGVVTVTNTGNGTYTFTMPAKNVTVSATFAQMSNDLANAEITGVSDDYIYTGSPISLSTLAVALMGSALTAGTDYDIAYTLNGTPVDQVQAAGDYVVTISPHSGTAYTGSKSKAFRVLNFTSATLSGVGEVYQHTGSERAIVPTVTITGLTMNQTLTANTDYSVSYTCNGAAASVVNAPGLYTMTVTGSGAYAACGTLTHDFIVLTFEKYNTNSGSLVTATTTDDNGSIVTASTTSMNGSWYVVTEDVTVGSRITVTGDVSLVLCDGATLTANRGIEVRSGNSLTIYSQSGNTGALTAYSADQYGSAIGGAGMYASGGTITIHGGEINATSHGDASWVIGGPNSTVTIYGGRVSAWYDLNGYAIGGDGATVNLSWCRSSDNIYAESFGGTVNLLGNFVFDDNRQQMVTTGNVNSNRRIVPQGSEWFVVFNSQGGSAVAQQSIDNNATATEPTEPTRTGYTFGGWYTDADCTDGNAYDFSAAVTANLTLYAKWTLTPFAINLPESLEATVGSSAATTATMGQTVTLTLKSGYTLTGSITATDANSQTVSLTDGGNGTYTFTLPASAVNVVAFAGVIEPGWTLAGTYKTQNFTADDTYYYGFVGTAGTGTELGTFVQVGGYVRVKPMRAYLVAPGGTPKAAARRMTRAADGEELPATLRVRLLGSNGETTGIINMEHGTLNMEHSTDAWYSLDGRRLQGEPTQRGIYINKGKKVIIK